MSFSERLKWVSSTEKEVPEKLIKNLCVSKVKLFYTKIEIKKIILIKCFSLYVTVC